MRIVSYLLVLIFIGVSFSWPFHGPTWQQKSNKQKLSLLWNAIVQDEDSALWPSTLELAELFLEPMNPTFNSSTDDMPYEGMFDVFPRKKLIHSVGCVGMAQLVTSENFSYTGLFSGADNVLMRFSTARAYDQTIQSFTPGISFKFLRSGVASANFMTMYSLEGQPSFNFFKHDLTNHVPDLSLNGSEALKILKYKFLTESDWPSMLGLSDFASFDQNGNEVSTPSFPFRLVFQPLSDLKIMFPDQYTANNSLCEQIGTLSPRQLYNVYAEDTPGDNPFLIGVVNLVSQVVTSNFGDTGLFFQHHLMEDDFQFYPQWEGPANDILKKQENTYYFNGYPDLPEPPSTS